MEENGLIYSFSDGKYWSRYNHCRVWDNDSYIIRVKNKYGEEVDALVDIENNVQKVLEYPILEAIAILANGDQVVYLSGDWVNARTITITNTRLDGKTYYSTNKTTWSEMINNELVIVGDKKGEQYYFKNVDSYGNESIISGFTINNTSVAPRNISANVIKTIDNRIKTSISVIESNAFPVKYSISYDNGMTWSEKQYNNLFLSNINQKGTYNIVCRAYNSTGLYIEGNPIKIII